VRVRKKRGISKGRR